MIRPLPLPPLHRPGVRQCRTCQGNRRRGVVRVHSRHRADHADHRRKLGHPLKSGAASIRDCALGSVFGLLRRQQCNSENCRPSTAGNSSPSAQTGYRVQPPRNLRNVAGLPSDGPAALTSVLRHARRFDVGRHRSDVRLIQVEAPFDRFRFGHQCVPQNLLDVRNGPDVQHALDVV